VKSQNIAGFVSMNILKFEFAEAIQQPLAAWSFSKRRRGNSGHAHLPASKFCFTVAKPR